MTGQPPDWSDEIERLRSLYSLDLIDRRASDRFDRFTRIACRTFDAPIAQFVLVGDDTQWFCSRIGADDDPTERSTSFCTHLIDTDLEVLVVEDTWADERFADLDIVVNDPFIRFYAGSPVSSPGGDRIGTICVLDVVPRTFDDDDCDLLRDLAALIESELEHVALSTTDDLTGLANRRGFHATTEQFLRLGERRSEPVTVLFADLDGLKTVNDLSGHGAGDELLQRAASAMRRAVRRSDMVARIGGDEFAIMSYGTDADGTDRMIDAIQAAIADVNDMPDVVHPLSMSIGTAEAVDGESVDDLLTRADHRMYASKRAGRAPVGDDPAAE